MQKTTAVGRRIVRVAERGGRAECILRAELRSGCKRGASERVRLRASPSDGLHQGDPHAVTGATSAANCTVCSAGTYSSTSGG